MINNESDFLPFVLLNDLMGNIDKDKKYCLFLDIDGTISEFNADPKLSFIPRKTLDIIHQLQQMEILVCAVTGREVNVAIQLFHPVQLPIAGTHGLEIQINSNHKLITYTPDLHFHNLKKEIKNLCVTYPELLIEYKAYSIALHYRKHPELANIAKDIMQNLQLNFPMMKLVEGKYVFELLPNQANKGWAIQSILEYFNLQNTVPIFIGDDLTDEAGFSTIHQYDGISIKVGQGDTNAQFRLKDVASVTEFLARFSQKLHKHSSIQI